MESLNSLRTRFMSTPSHGSEYTNCLSSQSSLLASPGLPVPLSALATRQFLFYASCMFGKSRQLETEEELYDVAVRALMRRAHSLHEMKQKQGGRRENKRAGRTVIARLY